MEPIEIFVRLAWLIGAAGFVIGLMRMSARATSCPRPAWRSPSAARPSS
jgi:hypothetical protein